MQGSDLSTFVWSTNMSKLWSGAYVQLTVQEAISYVPNQYERGYNDCSINIVKTKKEVNLAICDDKRLSLTTTSSVEKAKLVIDAARRTSELKWHEEYFTNSVSEAFGKINTILMLWDCENKELIIPQQMFQSDWFTLTTMMSVERSTKIDGGVIGNVVSRDPKVNVVVQSLLSDLSKWDIADASLLGPLLTNALQKSGFNTIAEEVLKVANKSSHSSSSTFLIDDPDPVLLHNMTSFCDLKSLRACACASASWRANLSWLLLSDAKLWLSQKPWLSSNEKSQIQARDWSRSYTIFEGMRRHGLVLSSSVTKKSFCIHVVGTDAVEGDSVEAMISVFKPLCSLLSGSIQNDKTSSKTAYRNLTVVLNGMDLLLPQSIKTSSTNSWKGMVHDISLELVWCPGEYTQQLLENGIQKPQMIICFNAGLWGYDTWKPTLFWVIKNGYPLIITSYTWKESEDDEEVINEVLNEVMNAMLETKDHSSGSKWCWKAERNPYGSTVKKQSYHENEYLRDNSWWMSTSAM